MEILIVESQSMVREILAHAFAGIPDVEVVGVVATGREAIEEMRRRCADLVLLDADISEAGLAPTVKEIKMHCPSCRVVVISPAPDPERLLEAVESGADGYASKHTAMPQLLRIMEVVSRGELAVPRGMTRHLVSNLLRVRSARQALGQLTKREREVLGLIFKGADNRAIGRALGISPETARTHAQNILAKLGVHSRIQAASFVARYGLVQELTEEDRPRAIGD